MDWFILAAMVEAIGLQGRQLKVGDVRAYFR